MPSKLLEKFKHKAINQHLEQRRQKWGLIAFSLIGATPCIYYVFLSNAEHPFYLDALLATCACLLYINAICLNFHDKYELSATICSLGIVPSLLAIVVSGGHLNTGLYWVFPYVITLFMLLGHIKGLIVNILSYALILAMLVIPDTIDAQYRQAEISRFLISYFVSIFFCFTSEYYRLRSFNQLALLNSSKQKQANTDPLTKLPNRRFIDAILIPELAKNPLTYLPASIVMIDIDHFKEINDTYGHHIGDKVLVHTTQCLTENVRDSDIVSRVGGEEFIFIMPSTDLVDAISVAEKLRETIEQTPYLHKQLKIPITISAGVSFIESPTELEDAINTADHFMYKAKSSGRNRVAFE